MSRINGLWAGALFALLSSGGNAYAVPTTMNFAGLQDEELVNDYYNGGTGSLGSGPGANYGASFVNATVLNENDNNIGGLVGSPNAISFLSGTSMTMNVAAGFSTGLGFIYSAPYFGGAAEIWSGQNDTGTLLATISLAVTPDGASMSGCNGADYCPYVDAGAGFAGVAQSVEFTGTPGFIFFDDITLGSATPLILVPESSTLGLFAVGLLGLGFAVARRRKAGAPTARLGMPAAASATAAVLAACVLTSATPAAAATSGNLIVDGDGESGACTADWEAVTTVPGWTVTQGTPALVCYSIGGFIKPVVGKPGNAFIADGPYGDSTLSQTANVASAAAAIDTGKITYNLSGWLGGYTTYTGQAIVTATFLSSTGQSLGTQAQLSGVTNTVRQSRTGFFPVTTTGTVPVGTRSIQVVLSFVDTSQSYNVGYADNLSLTLSTPVTAPVLTAPASQVPAFDHVFIVMMENTTYSQVIGDTTDAPFINSLATSGTLLANYYGVYHPSDENYLAIAGGSTAVSGAVYFPNIHITSRNIGDELEAAKKTWKAYEQGMGTPCNTNTNYDSYYEPDDAPFINYTDIASNPTRCAAHLFDTTQLTTDLKSAATTPNFSWIAADDYYDGEASGNGTPTSLQVQDSWLKQTLQPIMASPAWTNQRSLLLLTWDESSGATTSNHIATILVGSQGLVRAGATGYLNYNHYSSGRTIENALGLAPLTPNDAYAQPINEAFVTPAAPTTATLTTGTPVISKGTNIVFNFATPASKLSSTNWVGVYTPTQTPGGPASTVWAYAPTATGQVSLSTAGLTAGSSYVAWYLYNDAYTKLAGPVSFTVAK